MEKSYAEKYRAAVKMNEKYSQNENTQRKISIDFSFFKSNVFIG